MPLTKRARHPCYNMLMHDLAKCLLCIPLALITGCETTVRTQDVSHATPVTVNVPNKSKSDTETAAVNANALSLDDALGTDPAVQRLDKIIAAMLLYYAVKHDMPEQLTDLLSVDGDLQLRNPSNQPYVYHRTGMRSPGAANTVIVNDPAVSANGRRWCILNISPGKGTELQLEPRPIPENLFLGYQ